MGREFQNIFGHLKSTDDFGFGERAVEFVAVRGKDHVAWPGGLADFLQVGWVEAKIG